MVQPGGVHLIIDYFGVDPSKLNNCEEIKQLFKYASIKANATPLGDFFHPFGEGYGITGILALSESHMSIHTWPETGYCAVDIFMCGDSRPYVSMAVLNEYFNASSITIKQIARG